MLPNCEYKRCKKAADHSIGKLVHPNSYDGFGKPWAQTVWLCEKHRAKILKLLNIQIKDNAAK